MYPDSLAWPRADTPEQAKPVRPKIRIEADGAGVSYAEWQALVALGLDADFESIVDFVYSGKPPPFALNLPKASRPPWP
jgi:hypothetical protein